MLVGAGVVTAGPAGRAGQERRWGGERSYQRQAGEVLHRHHVDELEQLLHQLLHGGIGARDNHCNARLVARSCGFVAHLEGEERYDGRPRQKKITRQARLRDKHASRGTTPHA